MSGLKYAKLDGLILTAVVSGSNKFALIFAGDVRREAETLAGVNEDAFRYVDRRLQALRRAGKLTHVNGKWVSKQGENK